MTAAAASSATSATAVTASSGTRATAPATSVMGSFGHCSEEEEGWEGGREVRLRLVGGARVCVMGCADVPEVGQ